MKRLFRLLIPLCLAVTATACATTASETLQRTRDFVPETQRQTRHDAIQFVSKGAFITNIQDSRAFQPGTWVRGMPANELWPKDDTPPVVLIARVAERTKKLARLEILNYADGLRDSYDLTAVPYQNATPEATGDHAKNAANTVTAYPTHAINKRVLVPDHHDAKSALVAQPGLNDIRGNEVFGAIDLDRADQRLGAALTAILTVKATNAESADLVAARGEIPQNTRFILLDAFSQPGYSLDVTIHGGQAKDIAQRVLGRLDGLPAAPFIHVDVDPQTPSNDALVQKLGEKRSDRLDVHVVVTPDEVEIADQSLRLNLMPYPVLLGEMPTPDDIALAAAWRALTMAGDHASAILLLERAITDQDDARFARLAPALASTYHAIERDDWALEIALEAKARLDEQSDKTTRNRLSAAIAAIAADIARPNEFEDAFKQAKKAAPSLDRDTQRLIFRAFTLAAIVNEKYADDAHTIYHQNETSWSHYDEQLRCFALRTVDPGACDQGASQAKTPFDQLFFEGMQHLSASANDDVQMTSILTELDDIGAPFIAQLFWLKLAKLARNAETAETLKLNALGYAHRAQNHRDEAAMAADVRRSRAARGASMRDQALQNAIKRWQSLDLRAQLAALCYETATQDAHSVEERNKLLNYAYELYLSIGDVANAMTCLNKLQK